MTNEPNNEPLAEEENPVPEHFSSADFGDIPPEGTKLQPVADPKKQKRRLILLLVLVLLFLAIIAFRICSRAFDFYDRECKKLLFDYRQGETVDELTEVENGKRAKNLAEQITDGVALRAVLLGFTEQGDVSQTISAMDYSRSAGNEKLEVQTGTVDWLFTAKDVFRRQAGGQCEQAKGSSWSSVQEEALPPLYDYCFAVSPHDQVKLESFGSFMTTVGSKGYVCEIWLMEQPGAGGTEYCTLYRYYQDDRLCAVRVLKSGSSLMEVYDIQSYTLN